MDELRKPFLIAAVVLAVLCIAVETGSSLWQRGQAAVSAQSLGQTVTDPETALLLRASGEQPGPPRPGIGIASLIALDILVLFTMALVVSPFVISHQVTGRMQGIVTLIVAILLLITTFTALIKAIGLTLLMAGLFVATPFGTVAYLLTWGFFDTGGAAVTLGILLLLKLGLCACLLLANQRFAKNKGLVLVLITTLVATLLLQFLHGFVPGVLVSITDGIGAILILILALIWLIFMLIGSVISIVKAIV